MIANQNIVFRKDDDVSLLFNPDDGTVTSVNATGAFIWQCLAEGLDTEEIIGRLHAKCGQNPPARDVLARDVQAFLGMLAAKGFLLDYSGPVRQQSGGPDDNAAPKLTNRALYEMHSMLRVFVPGDALVLREQPFGEFQPGDIAAFFPDGPNAPGIVHRIMRRDGKALVTMGDNNPGPDQRRLTEADAPRLVVERIRPDGRHLPVCNGPAGRRQFRWNRIRRILRKCASCIITPFLPLMFWRRTVTDSYAYDNIVQYYYRRRLIARSVDGKITFIPPYRKLFYRILKP